MESPPPPDPGPAASRSFKDALTPQTPSNSLLFTSIDPKTAMLSKRTGTHKGLPAIHYARSLITDYSHSFQCALIGKFSHGYNKDNPNKGRPSLDKLQKYFLALDFRGEFSLGLLDNRHVLIRFHLMEDYIRFYSRSVWYINGVFMRIFKWSPAFHVDRESSLVPVWVSFPRLPLQFFNSDALFALASLLGTPLRMDSATAAIKRPSVARVQIEIDVLKERHPKVWIGMDEMDGFWQKVDYENVPSYCKHCWHIGHSEDLCHIHNPELKVPAQQSKRYVPKPITAPEKPQPSAGSPADEVPQPIEASNVIQQPIGNATQSIPSDASQPLCAASVQQPDIVAVVVADDAPEALDAFDAAAINSVSAPTENADQEITKATADDQATDVVSQSLVQYEIPVAAVIPTVLSTIDSPMDTHSVIPPALSPDLALVDQDFITAPSTKIPTEITPVDTLIVDLPYAPLPTNVPSDHVMIEDQPSNSSPDTNQHSKHLEIATQTKLPLYTTPVHISNQQLFQHQVQQFDVQPFIAQSSMATFHGPETQNTDEESADDEDEQDFLDKNFIRDDVYLQQRQSRKQKRGNLDVQFRRGRGRPPGSRGRTYFDVVRTISTRAKTVD